MRKYCLVFFLLQLLATTWAGELRCLRPGAPVICLYKEGRYYPGRVDGLGDSIDVTFQNGQQQNYNSYTNDVVIDDVPDSDELMGGSRVLARRPSSRSFEPGFVNGSIEGLPMNDTFLVNFDTGDSFARNIEDIRLAVKPRSCMNEKGIYIGCFLNVVNNFLTNYYPVNPTDVATCNWACFQRGFRFAGLQNGTWCFCGNNVNDSLRVDDNDCNIACRDSRQDVCGGYRRMTVYWTGADFDNKTSDLSEFADDTGQLTPHQDEFKSESSSESQCSDLHDSVECNTWADQSKCIENPDWMIANCKKSCYACSYNDRSQDTTDKPDSSLKTYAPVASTQAHSQANAYQPPAQSGYQASSSYAQDSYSTSQDVPTQSSSKKSDHPALDTMSNTAGYLGCYTDSPSSHDLEYLADIRPLSIRACVTKCKSMRFPYAGVQSSTSCYCGLHYGKYGQLEHEDCNTPCEADSSEMCGGVFKNSLYHTGFPVKFKSAENVNRGNSPSGSNTATGQAYSPNSYNNYVSKSSQPSYPQPNLGYTPPVYPPPTSPYIQATIPSKSGYPQTTNIQTNGYPPAYSYNNQPSPPIQSGTSTPTVNADTRDYSPMDSSSYRWRETYVKLRQQEQERYSKPSLRNLWKLHRTENTWPKQFLDRANAKSKTSTHSGKSTKNLSSQSKSYSPEKSAALYNQLISHVYKDSLKGNSRGDKKILRKDGKRHSGKPGIFLRKKASKKNNFLAFLPHEVTEDESLLENVYNMLSVMLKNLRKHRRNSLKNLKKYLQLSESEEKVSKFTRKAPLHSPQHKESVARSEKPVEQKFDGTKDSGPSHHAENHLSKGQKQLSKKRKEISNSQRSVTQTMTYVSHGVLHAKQNANQSLTTNGNPVDSHHTSSHHTSSHHTTSHHTTSHNATSTAKSAILNKETQSFTNIVQPHHDDVDTSIESQLSKDTPGDNKFPNSEMQSRGHSMSSEVHRNMSEDVLNIPKKKYHTKSMVSESKSENHRTMSKVNQKASIDYKNVPSKMKTMLKTNLTRNHGDTTAHSRQVPNRLEKFGDIDFSHHYKNRENNIENQSLRKNASLDATKYTTGTIKKLNKEKMPSSKTEDRAVLTIDTPTAKKQTSDEDDMTETSNDDIISTIVDLLDKEKAMRNIKHKDETKQARSKHGKRKKKRHNKKEKRKKRMKKRKRKKRKKKRKRKLKKNINSKRYKKDRLGQVSDSYMENDDENLMEEAETFSEKME